MKHLEISKDLGIPSETIRNHVRVLEDGGYLASVNVPGIGIRYCVKNSQRRFEANHQKEDVKKMVQMIVNSFAKNLTEKRRVPVP